MILELLPIIALVLIASTSITLFLTENWRLSILLLSIQYLGVFILVQMNWPVIMASVKLVAGWISGAIMGMAMVSIPAVKEEMDQSSFKHTSASRLFYMLAAILVGLVILTRANQALEWFPDIHLEQAWGGYILIGMGLFKLGFSQNLFSATFGLLTALAGFEIIYSTIAISALLAGLLAGITLGIALAGSYLIMSPYLEET